MAFKSAKNSLALFMLTFAAALPAAHGQVTYRVDQNGNRQVRVIGNIHQEQNGVGQNDTVEINNNHDWQSEDERERSQEKRRYRRDDRRADVVRDKNGNAYVTNAERDDGRRAYLNERGQLVIERAGQGRIVMDR